MSTVRIILLVFSLRIDIVFEFRNNNNKKKLRAPIIVNSMPSFHERKCVIKHTHAFIYFPAI